MWRTWLVVWWTLRRQPLPDAVAALGNVRPRQSTDGAEAVALGRLVWRRLRLGPWQPLCLPRAMVLFRILRAQGLDPALVIGLAADKPTKDAHAWVELDGQDVGPPPGRNGHAELVRYSAR